VLDLVLERGGGGFGSGSHSTTRMCLELMLEVDAAGGAADLGCGLGTLAIAAARLGWDPVIAVDRMEGAVEAARANGARNGVDIDWRVGDLESGEVPLAELVLVNAPPPVQARVAAALGAAAEGGARAVIVSGVVPTELDAVAVDYAAAGWTVAAAREQDGWAAALLEPRGA
jgi:ribosomal protein L11 methyltransferase